MSRFKVGDCVRYIEHSIAIKYTIGDCVRYIQPTPESCWPAIVVDIHPSGKPIIAFNLERPFTYPYNSRYIVIEDMKDEFGNDVLEHMR